MNEPTTPAPDPDEGSTGLPETAKASYQIRAHGRGLDKAPTIAEVTDVISTALEGAFGGAFSVEAERIDR